MNTIDNFKGLVYIASDSRSGSTLLNLLLDNHPEIVGVGELIRLHELKYHSKKYGETSLCTCEKPLSDCSFWQRVEGKLNQQGMSTKDLPTQAAKPSMRGSGFLPYFFEFFLIFANQPLLKFTEKYLGAIREDINSVKNCWLIAETISTVTGRPVVVDSSKWAKQFKLLYLLKPQQFKLIFLVRDGRGVIASKMRRAKTNGHKMSVKLATLYWLVINLKCLLLQMTLPKDKKLMVKYEDLCRDPEQQLQRICHFIGLPFNECTSLLSKHDKHLVGGSPRRFDKAETKIKLDERWKYSLTQEEVRTFNCMAGFLNKFFGYSQ